MRKNTKEVFYAWRQGKSSRGQRSIWTDGRTIFSYDTPILTPCVDPAEPPRLNLTKYSVTTTVHQRGIEYLLKLSGFAYREAICPV